MSENFYDKLTFIVYYIILGVVMWMYSIFNVSYVHFIKRIIENGLLQFIVSMITLCLFIWFMRITNKKFCWKSFGKNSDGIACIITIVILVIMVYTIGVPEIIF